MKKLIASLGISAGPKWQQQSATVQRLRNHLFIDDVALLLPDGAVRSFQGIGPEEIDVMMTGDPPALPRYVVTKRKELWKPAADEPNWFQEKKSGKKIYVRPKAFLGKWLPPQSDQGNRLRVTIGHSDYLIQKAVEICENEIHNDIVVGLYDFAAMPKLLCAHTIVLTSDNQMVACQRTHRDMVDYYATRWSLSLEETVDGEKDKDDNGIIDLFSTVRRGLGEELGLGADEVRASEIRIVAVGAETYLVAPFFAIARVPIDGVEVLESFYGAVDAEHAGIDLIPFTVKDCLRVLRCRHHHDVPLHGSSRFRILCLLFNRLGYENARRQINDAISNLAEPERATELPKFDCVDENGAYHKIVFFHRQYDTRKRSAAKCVKLLFDAYMRGAPWVKDADMLIAIGSEGGRLNVLFQEEPIWVEDIVVGGKGKYQGCHRLCAPVGFREKH